MSGQRVSGTACPQRAAAGREGEREGAAIFRRKDESQPTLERAVPRLRRFTRRHCSLLCRVTQGVSRGWGQAERGGREGGGRGERRRLLRWLEGLGPGRARERGEPGGRRPPRSSCRAYGRPCPALPRAPRAHAHPPRWLIPASSFPPSCCGQCQEGRARRGRQLGALPGWS